MTENGRILLVEDRPQDVELTLTALGRHKRTNEVVVASDGEEALGYLLLQRMRGDEALKRIPVVMLTPGALEA